MNYLSFNQSEYDQFNQWFEEAEDEYESTRKAEPFIGRIETSVELGVSPGLQQFYAPSFRRLEPYLNDLYLFAAVTDRSMNDDPSNLSFKQWKKRQRCLENFSFSESDSYGDSLQDVGVFLKRINQVVSEEEVETLFYSTPWKIPGFREHVKRVEGLCQLVEYSEDKEVSRVSFGAYGAGNELDKAFEEASEDLGFTVFIAYQGDEIDLEAPSGKHEREVYPFKIRLSRDEDSPRAVLHNSGEKSEKMEKWVDNALSRFQ